MFPLSAAVVIGRKDLLAETMRALDEIAVRLVLELSELPQDWNGFADRVERLRPHVILLDIGEIREPLEKIIGRLQATAMQPAVIAISTHSDPQLILQAFRAGAVEFLCPPFGQTLKDALDRLASKHQDAKQSTKRSGKTVGFLSAKGGCGATTICCQTAREMAALNLGTILLADTDLQSGMVGFLVKAKNPYSLADAVKNVQRLDASFWHAIVSNGTPNLEVVSAPQTPSSRQLPIGEMKQVLAFARAQYDWTLLDLGRGASTATLSLADLVDRMLIVTTPEVPALHQCKQVIQTLLESGYPSESLAVLLNRNPKRGDITLDETESLLGAPILATVANDYHALQEAFAEGHLAAEQSHFGRSIASLASKLTGTTGPKKKLFSLFG